MIRITKAVKLLLFTWKTYFRQFYHIQMGNVWGNRNIIFYYCYCKYRLFFIQCTNIFPLVKQHKKTLKKTVNLFPHCKLSLVLPLLSGGGYMLVALFLLRRLPPEF